MTALSSSPRMEMARCGAVLNVAAHSNCSCWAQSPGLRTQNLEIKKKNPLQGGGGQKSGVFDWGPRWMTFHSTPDKNIAGTDKFLAQHSGDCARRRNCNYAPRVSVAWRISCSAHPFVLCATFLSPP